MISFARFDKGYAEQMATALHLEAQSPLNTRCGLELIDNDIDIGKTAQRHNGRESDLAVF